jgi:pimeloyl-ACP methyl ester carboxylesterase
MIALRTFEASDGLVLSCADYGGEGRPPLMFVHGGSAHARWWDFVAPAFVDRFHVLALDQRGHGESPWTPDWSYGTRQYVADLATIISRWGLGKPVLVGHSMGGHTVLNYAADYSDELRALVVIDAPAGYPPEAVAFLREIAERPSRPYDSLDDACAKFKTNPPQNNARPEVLRHVAEHSFRQDGDGKWVHKMDRRTLIREPLSAWKGLARISCPTLYVRAESRVLERTLAEKIAAAIPHCAYTEVANSFHHVMIDNPEGLIEVLNNFLKTLV